MVPILTSLTQFVLPPLQLTLRSTTRLVPLTALRRKNLQFCRMHTRSQSVLERTADDASAQTLRTLLSDDKYHIEFNGFLSNHVKHALIALGGLQAPAERIQGYYDEYTELTPYGFKLDPAEVLNDEAEDLKEAEWEALLGAKKEYPRLLQFFKAAIDREGLPAVLQKFAPKLLEGFPGALTHGIIHLGWALDAAHQDMTIEGLAYFSYCHVSVQPERFEHGAVPDASPFQSLLRIADAAEREGLGSWVKRVKTDAQYAHVHPELKITGFQHDVAKVIAAGHPLLSRLPRWLDDMPTADLFEALYRDVSLLYLATAGQPSPGPDDHGSFVVLHALTSLWALEVIARSLPEAHVRQAVKCYWSGLSAILVTGTAGQGIPSRAGLEAVAAKFPTDGNLKDGPAEEEWGAVVARAWGEEEEHNIKLVYVQRELWRRYGQWPGYRVAAESFTVTPNVGPGRNKFTA